jgi:hypothetical protein
MISVRLICFGAHWVAMRWLGRTITGCMIRMENRLGWLTGWFAGKTHPMR